MKQYLAIILAKVGFYLVVVVVGNIQQDFRNVFSDRPTWVPMTTIFEGEEPICFKEKFMYWQDRNIVTPRQVKPSRLGMLVQQRQLIMNREYEG